MTTANRATAFLAAFNDIESHLRDLVGARNSDSFRHVIRWARKNGHLRDDQADDLSDYTDLRNAISHGEYRDFRPIAEPLPETVEAITFLRDVLLDPPLAMEVLGHQEVVTFGPDDHIADTFEVLRTTTISQFPVYDEERYRGLVNTDMIARWLAAHDGQVDPATRIGYVMEHSGTPNRAVFLSRDATAQQAVEKLSTPDDNGLLPQLGIVTEVGRPDHRPFRVIAGHDVALLLHAVYRNP